MRVSPVHDGWSVAQGSPFSTFIALAALCCVIYAVYYRFLHPLSKHPGPFICSLTNFWKLWATVTDQLPEQMIKLHEIYGDVVRIGPNDLHFNQCEAVEDIYKRGWQKGDFYLGFGQKNPGLFSERNESIHGKRKRMFGSNFTMSAVRSYEGIVNTRYAILRKQLDRFAESGEKFDLRHYITYCIVDILGELAFSEAFGNQIDEDPKKIPRVSEFLYASCVAGQVPLLAPVFDWMKTHIPPSAEMLEILEARNVMMRLVTSSLRRRQGKELDRPDILGRIVAAAEEGTGEPLNRSQVIAEAVTLVVGGTHTTGNTLHILFANLSRNPQYLQKVIQEIDERLPPLELDQPCYDITGLEDKLDFVNMAIKENFRNDAVGTFNMPRAVPPQGATIAGLQVPGGTQCSMNIHAFHHNASIWGNDHASYDPTRWYDKRAQGLSQFVIPYSVGKRACAGQNLANANILKMATTLLRCYEFDFLNKDEPMRIVSHGDSDLRTPLLVTVKLRRKEFQG